MTGVIPMFLISMISGVYCLTFFFTQDEGCTSDANLASYLFLTAALFLVWDMTLIPDRYKLAMIYQIPTELILGLIVTEVMAVWFWCKFESLIKLSVKAVTDDEDACNYILIALSFLLLWNVANITGAIKLATKIFMFLKAKATGGCAPPLFDSDDDSLANITFIKTSKARGPVRKSDRQARSKGRRR